MHHRFLRVQSLLVGIVLIWACALSLQSRADCKLRVGWDDWPPYIVGSNGQFGGLEYDLLLSTANDAGCQLEMIQVPWVRALKMLNDGWLDLLYGAGYSD